MLKYALRRLWQTVPTTLGILLLAFVLFNVVGGSPAETLLGKNATAEAIAAFNAKWGYDRPLPVQFVRYLGDLCRGDLGFSIEHQEPVPADGGQEQLQRQLSFRGQGRGGRIRIDAGEERIKERSRALTQGLRPGIQEAHMLAHADGAEHTQGSGASPRQGVIG